MKEKTQKERGNKMAEAPKLTKLKLPEQARKELQDAGTRFKAALVDLEKLESLGSDMSGLRKDIIEINNKRKKILELFT